MQMFSYLKQTTEGIPPTLVGVLIGLAAGMVPVVLSAAKLVLPALGMMVKTEAERRQIKVREIRELNEEHRKMIKALNEEHRHDRAEWREERLQLRKDMNVANKKATDALELVETVQEAQHKREIEREAERGTYEKAIGSLRIDVSRLSTELGDLKTLHTETLANLEAEMEFRLIAEKQRDEAMHELDTLRLQKTRLERQIDEMKVRQSDMQKEIDTLKAEVTRLKETNGQQNTPPPDTIE